MNEMLAGGLAVAIFVLVSTDPHLIAVAPRIARDARSASRVIADPELDDAVKERRIQAASKQMGLNLMHLVGLAATIILIASVPVLAAHLLGFSSIWHVGNWLGSLQGIIVSVVISGAGYPLFIRLGARA